jgi:hypothetical protein
MDGVCTGEVVELFLQAELRPGTLLGSCGSSRLVSSELHSPPNRHKHIAEAKQLTITIILSIIVCPQKYPECRYCTMWPGYLECIVHRHSNSSNSIHTSAEYSSPCLPPQSSSIVVVANTRVSMSMTALQPQVTVSFSPFSTISVLATTFFIKYCNPAIISEA